MFRGNIRSLYESRSLAIAAFLRAMEERTIAHHGLQRFWRRTPHSFERAYLPADAPHLKFPRIRKEVLVSLDVCRRW